MTWMQTRSGKSFDLLNPRAADVDFEDIAYHLAHINRFNGAVGVYSVAQHCCLGSEYLDSIAAPIDHAFAFHLHDAHEAYIGDITRPAADALSHGATLAPRAIHNLKHDLDAAIWAAAGFVPSLAALAVVGEVDLEMLRTERDQLLGSSPSPWTAAVETSAPLPITIERWLPARAAHEWLVRFNDYRRALRAAA